MTSDIFGRCKEASIVFLWLEDYYVTFGKEEQKQRKQSAKTDTMTQSCDFVGFVAYVDGQKGYPNDQGCVHGEANKFCLVEILGHVASLKSVPRAHSDQKEVESKGNCSF